MPLMLAARMTQASLRALDWLAAKTLPPDETPEHLQVGRRGEEDAYFYLRRRGYTIIARNFRSPQHRGELDLVGWDGNVLCFIEVKTRTTRDVVPAQVAVDHEKQKELRLVARDFLRHLPSYDQDSPVSRSSAGRETQRSEGQWRFDVIAVYYEHGFRHPSFELFQNAFPVSYNHDFVRSH